MHVAKGLFLFKHCDRAIFSKHLQHPAASETLSNNDSKFLSIRIRISLDYDLGN